MDILKALEILRRLEVKAQDLYEHYHNIFTEDTETSSAFFQLSLDEKSHADLIDYQIRTVRRNKSLFADVEFDAAPLEELIGEMDTQIANTQQTSVDDAVRFLLRLESDALEYHYRNMIGQSNPEVGELIKKLSEEDRKHADMLKRLAADKNISL